MARARGTRAAHRDASTGAPHTRFLEANCARKEFLSRRSSVVAVVNESPESSNATAPRSTLSTRRERWRTHYPFPPIGSVFDTRALIRLHRRRPVCVQRRTRSNATNAHLGDVRELGVREGHGDRRHGPGKECRGGVSSSSSSVEANRFRFAIDGWFQFPGSMSRFDRSNEIDRGHSNEWSMRRSLGGRVVSIDRWTDDRSADE